MTHPADDQPAREEAGAADPYQPGSIVSGKYELTRIIGSGGMGSVWLAKNRALQAEVAVKLIHRGRASADHCARLLQEARATARIEHPSVVRIFDFGETERGDPFIVMELLRGEDLRDLLHRVKRVAADEAVPIVLCVASALVAAHAKGVIHRDLKPENVFLVPGADGVVVPKVVDFGIAKVVDRELAEGRVVTRDGVLVGSPDYMSPEQARGAVELDVRSDVWSTCVVLYELVTGRLPFEGENYNQLLSAILLDAPVSTVSVLAGDAELWRILEKGLAKLPGERWPSMRDLGKELAAWAIGHDIESDAAGASIARHWLGNSRRSLTRVSTAEIDTRPPPAPQQRNPEVSGPRSASFVHSTSSSVAPAVKRPMGRWASLLAIGGALAVAASLALMVGRATSAADAPGPVAASPSAGDITIASAAPAQSETSAVTAVVVGAPSATSSAPAPRPSARPRPGPKPAAPKSTRGKPGAMPVPTEAPF